MAAGAIANSLTKSCCHAQCTTRH